MKFLQFAVSGAVALLFSGAALTQTTGFTPPATMDPAGTLSGLDADRDGSISRAEAVLNPRLTHMFSALDANTNGALEPGEFARFETLGAASTRGTPGAPGSPGSPPAPGAPTPGTPVSPDTPTGHSSAPSGSTPAPSGATPPPGD